MGEFEVSGNGILLRPVSVEDSADILDGLLQGDLGGAVPGSEGINDVAGAREMVSGLVGRARMGAELHFAVLRDGKAIGMCALYGLEGAGGSASIGYWIGKHHRRLGHGREAVRLLTIIAFDHLHLGELHAVSGRSNEASGRLLRSLGFSEDGENGETSGAISFSLRRK